MKLFMKRVQAEKLGALNIFSLTIRMILSKNSFTIYVQLQKVIQATLEVSDYNVGLLAINYFLMEVKLGGRTKQDRLGPDNVKLGPNTADKIDGQDAFNIMRFSPIEISAINPFNFLKINLLVDQVTRN